MKFTIEQGDFASVLSKLAGIVQSKNTIPILANVAIFADNDGIKVCATDLEIEAKANAPADVTGHGAITVNAAMLTGIVAKMPKGKVISFGVDDGRVVLTSGRSNFNIGALPIEDFPIMASDEYDNTAVVSADNLSKLFGRVRSAMSTEETRYYLNGVYMHNVDGALRTVATDGHRAAQMTIDCGAYVSSVIVPSKMVLQIIKVFTTGDITVRSSDTKVQFESGDTVITSKVVDGTYPDYTRVIGDGGPIEVTFSAKEVMAASARVALVGEDRVRAVKMSIADGVCTLSVNGPVNTASEDVEVDADGVNIDVGFNYKYLADVLAQCPDGDVLFKFTDASSPAMIFPQGFDGFVSVVMPCRV